MVYSSWEICFSVGITYKNILFYPLHIFVYCLLLFRERTSNDGHVSSENVSDLDAGKVNKRKKKRTKGNVSKHDKLKAQSRRRNSGSTNSSLINYEYHPIATFFNDY